MTLSQVRAQVGVNEPKAARGINAPGGEASNVPVAPPLQGDRSAAVSRRAGPPWLVRNSRKATITLAVAVLAASPFAYRYLQREFGPDPLAGIKVDQIKVDAISGTVEGVKPARTGTPEVKPSATKPGPAAGAVGLAPMVALPPTPASRARPVAATPVAPTSGVTHTRSAVATPLKPEAAPPIGASPRAREINAKPPESIRADQPLSGACAEAVAALGLCDPNSTGKAR